MNNATVRLTASRSQILAIAAIIGTWFFLAGGLVSITAKELVGTPVRLELPLWVHLLVLLFVGINRSKSAVVQIASFTLPMILLFAQGTLASEATLFITALIATPVTAAVGKKRNW